MKSKYLKLKKILGIRGNRQYFNDLLYDFFFKNINKIELKNSQINIKNSYLKGWEDCEKIYDKALNEMANKLKKQTDDQDKMIDDLYQESLKINQGNYNGKITAKWVQEHNGRCSLEDIKQIKKIGNVEKIINELIKVGGLNDANWLITKYMNRKQNVQYAIFAAELVIDIFEEEYPEDKRPRETIRTAKKYLKNSSIENKRLVDVVTDAEFAASAAYADYIGDASYAADAAAYAAKTAIDADYDIIASYAVNAAVNATADAEFAVNDAVREKTKIKILKYGIKIIYDKVNN